MIDKVRAWEAKILRLTFSRKNMGGLQETDCTVVTEKLKEDGFAAADRKNACKIWTTMTWAVYMGDVPIMRALRSVPGWRTTAWWRSWASWCMAWDPTDVIRWKHKVGFHNRGIQWDTPILDKAYGATTAPQGICYSQFT